MIINKITSNTVSALDFWSGLTSGSSEIYLFDHKSKANSFFMYLKEEEAFVKSLQDFDVKWLESPYGYPGTYMSSNISIFNLSHSISININEYALIFCRLSVANLLDHDMLLTLESGGFEIVDGGNDIFVFTDKHKNFQSTDLMTAKRRSKLRKAERRLRVLSFTFEQLLSQQSILQSIQNIYFDHLKSKNAGSHYYFPAIWTSLDSILLNHPHTFYLAFGGITGMDLQGFLLEVGRGEVSIFLSAMNMDGRVNEAATILRSKCIDSCLSRDGLVCLNTGGVNVTRGGNNSFKKSFGASEIPYKVAVWRNQILYNKLLGLSGESLDLNKIKFWESF